MNVILLIVIVFDLCVLYFYFVIEGLIGVGKMMFVCLFGECWLMQMLFECLQDNLFFECFYCDIVCYVLLVQLLFVLQCVQQVCELIGVFDMGCFVIVDFMLQKNDIFVWLNLLEDEWQLYCLVVMYVDVLQVLLFDFVVYLQVSFEVLFLCIQKCGLLMELQIGDVYLCLFVDVYNEFFYYYDCMLVLMVVVEYLNLLDFFEDFVLLVECIEMMCGCKEFFVKGEMMC